MLLNYPFFHYGSISEYIIEQKYLAAVVMKVQKYQLLSCVQLLCKKTASREFHPLFQSFLQWLKVNFLYVDIYMKKCCCSASCKRL